MPFGHHIPYWKAGVPVPVRSRYNFGAEEADSSFWDYAAKGRLFRQDLGYGLYQSVAVQRTSADFPVESMLLQPVKTKDDRIQAGNRGNGAGSRKTALFHVLYSSLYMEEA